MRTYWLRVVLGAVGIFIVGMLAWTLVRKGRDHVVEVVTSDRPISIPLAFVPFTLDGQALGTLRRVEVLRSSPEQVSGVNFTVKLADSVQDARLAGCVLVAREDLNHLNPGRAFSCVAAGDTVGRNLAPIGHVETQRGGRFLLLARAGTLDSLRLHLGPDHGQQLADSLAQASADSIERMADSIEAVADSIAAAGSVRADSVREAASTLRDSIQREVREQVRRAREAPRKPAAP